VKVLVIIPTYNESANISEVLTSVLLHNPGVEILVVDDNSPDGTAGIAMDFAETEPKVKVLKRISKQGLGPAYLAGFNFGFESNFDRIVEMDADGSHRAEDLAKMLQVDADLVIGSRWVDGGSVVNWPWYRVLISRFGNGYARLMLGTKIRDMTAGFRVYRAGFLRELVREEVSSQGYSFQVELAYRASRLGKVAEVPIVFVERERGQSKMTLGIVIEALVNVTKWGIGRLTS
jgi:dolichol-phosphate mannosyltransferase